MKNILLILAICVGSMNCIAQTKYSISYSEYMEMVKTKNLSFAAERLNVSIAEAHVRASKVFNDPQLSFEYANNDDHRLMMGQSYSAGISKTFSIAKRRAAINLATSEKELTAALLEDYFRNLRADATIIYFEALKQLKLYQVKLDAYESVKRLAQADSVKYTLGKITKVDATQSKLEAGIVYNELLQTETELRNALAAFNPSMGRFSVDTLYYPKGELMLHGRNFILDDLLITAINNRADLAAALQNIDVAHKALSVAKRERNIDFDLALGINHNTEVRNEIAPAPKFNGITVGIAVPLKFSNFNRGTIKSAMLQTTQAEYIHKQAELQVQTEVMQSYAQYISLAGQVENYHKGMLSQATSVIDGKIYSYDRGETSLLEVLNAQRTHNDVRSLYIETLFNHAVALVELERSVGIWDIEIEQEKPI